MADTSASKCPHLAGMQQEEHEESGKKTGYNKGGQGVYYGDYLGLEKVLNAQHPLTNAHEEMLFIVTHQTYELWFKQIIFELRSVYAIFEKNPIPSSEMLIATRRLKRICEIQRVCIAQFRVLESMAPMEFMEFRDALVPASGFQSYQFRELEILLGLQEEKRTKLNGCVFLSALNSDHQAYLEELAKGRSMFELVEAWLERTPFVDIAGWKFWDAYKAAVKDMMTKERTNVMEEWEVGEKTDMMADLGQVEERFKTLFDESLYSQARKDGHVRLSHRALQATILINLYRNEPSFQGPFEFLQALVNVDENISLWRHAHAQMVHRMIGMRLGTGGSSGVFYLRTTTGSKYRIFNDFANIATYIIPTNALPPIPAEAQKQMAFFFDVAKPSSS